MEIGAPPGGLCKFLKKLKLVWMVTWDHECRLDAYVLRRVKAMIDQVGESEFLSRVMRHEKVSTE